LIMNRTTNTDRAAALDMGGDVEETILYVLDIQPRGTRPRDNRRDHCGQGIATCLQVLEVHRFRMNAVWC